MAGGDLTGEDRDYIVWKNEEEEKATIKFLM